MKHLILGGARSGKSRHAQTLAEQQEQQGFDIVFLATADPQHNDEAMQARVKKHQDDRPAHWNTVECPLTLADELAQQAQANRLILVDCLTLWLTNCLMQEDQQYWPQQKEALLSIIKEIPGQIVFVSNEVGNGIVPLGELSRRFVDECGWLHQQLAETCDTVTLVTAGLPLTLKS